MGSKCLVAGWFSFVGMGATAGDLMAKDLVCTWLGRAGRQYDVAYAPPFTGGVAWPDVATADYRDVIFVCGPFGNGEPLLPFFDKFAGLPLYGVNLTMLQDLSEWNPFERLWERDSSRSTRPDITFLTQEARKAPVVGSVFIHPQEEYGARDGHLAAHAAIREVLSARQCAVVPIDTQLDTNQYGLTAPEQVDALIGRMDMVVTTRLHGTVLALKNGVPALAVDPIHGGAKISRQAEIVGWPILHRVETLRHDVLLRDFDFCLTEAARQKAAECRDRAIAMLAELPGEFIAALR